MKKGCKYGNTVSVSALAIFHLMALRRLHTLIRFHFVSHALDGPPRKLEIFAHPWGTEWVRVSMGLRESAATAAVVTHIHRRKMLLHSYVDQCLASCRLDVKLFAACVRFINVRLLPPQHFNSTIVYRMLRLTVAACDSHWKRKKTLVTGNVSPGAHGKCKRKHWMAEKIGERKNARRKNVCLCKGRTHKRAHTRIHGHGADGWKASHSEHEYRRMEFDIVHKSHTNAQPDKHVRVRTLFIACDAKRLPLHGHPSHSKHTHTLSLTHRLGTESLSLSGVLILNF